MSPTPYQRKTAAVLGGTAIFALILTVIGGLQPVLDCAFGGGTLFASKALAEGQAPSSGGPTAPESAPAKEEAPAPGSETPTEDIFRTDPLATLTLALQQKQLDLDDREKAVAEQEARLALLRTEVEQRLGELEEMRKGLQRDTETFTAQLEAKKNKEAKKWVGIYQAMQPAAAALVIESIQDEDQGLAIDLLSQMEPKKASKILDAMKKDKSIALVESGLNIGRR